MTSARSLRLWLTMVSTATVVTLDAAEPAPNAAALQFFEKKVRPLLVNNCYNCHSADHKEAGGLRVDDHRAILKGGGRGAGVVAGKPEESVLIRAVKQTDPKLKMPPDYKLSDGEIAVLEQWIRDGAVWPAIEVPDGLTAEDPEYHRLRREHWAWQPLTSPAVPSVQNAAWPRDDIDRFLLAKLEQERLNPVGDADRVTWLRRVTFDLTGLPPTPGDLSAYLGDQTEEADERVVDRLLASAAFGERWGRHWLDVARFGESTGSARNLPYPQAWKYRDYVIDAFNADKPYDRFVQEQIAGDLLPAVNDAQRKEQLIATGFLALGVKDVNQRFKVRFVMDNIYEQIDTVTRSVLGLTVSCARCHDHKFDPISTAEYYGLAGIFHSTDLCAGLRNKMGGGGLAYYDTDLLLMLSKPDDIAPEHAAKIAAAKAAADEAQAELIAIRDTAAADELAPNGRPKRQVARQKWNRLQAEYIALSDPAAYSEVALGVREAKTVGDTEIRIRGEAEQLGPVVPRRFLKVVDLPNQPAIPAKQSGRLQLAQWMTSPQNPLTSRVIVNRIWHHLFGAGLVRSVDNFGLTGDTPSHPELLDHLAARFIADGWSLKRHIRAVVLTRAYRLSSTTSDEHLAVDPANRFVWRHSPRRLSAEELRDATLAAAGLLDTVRPNGSAAQTLPVVELRNNGPESQRIVDAGRASRNRSVYPPLLRTIVPTALETFDFADQGLVTGSRDTTTVPTQALYLLNDAFVRRNALSLAEALLADNGDDIARIERAYLLTVGREPTSSEVDRVRFYLADYADNAAETLTEQFAAVAARDAALEAERTKPADATTPNNAVPAASGAVALAAQMQVANADDVDQSDAPVRQELITPAMPGPPPGRVLCRRSSARQSSAMSVNPLLKSYALRPRRPCSLPTDSHFTRPRRPWHTKQESPMFPISRRDALKTAGTGFGYLALAGMLGMQKRSVRAATPSAIAPLAPKPQHFAAKAKRIIFLFMEGAASHVDTWEYKPKLQASDGQPAPGGGKLVASKFQFAQHGETGTWVSELYPHVAKQVDKLCFIRGLHTDTPAHPQAVIQLHTGARIASVTRPSMGAWLLYGLGTENQDLPGYITINPSPNFGGAVNYGSAFLPAHFQGTRINDAGYLPNLQAETPTPLQRKQIDLIQAMNHDLRATPGAPTELDGVIQSYELAFKMQGRVPELLDISSEPQAVQDAYGVKPGPAGSFARQCLMARRLSEAGVRFVQVRQPGWDHQNNLHKGLIANSTATDQPTAALLADLEQRGLLDETLVLFGSEFGRLPSAQGPDGRDHNITGYPMWLAGAGVKKGFSYGATDEYGTHAVEGRMHTMDLHATLLALMGLDHELLTYSYAGRDFRLTDVGGRIVQELFA